MMARGHIGSRRTSNKNRMTLRQNKSGGQGLQPQPQRQQQLHPRLKQSPGSGSGTGQPSKLHLAPPAPAAQGAQAPWWRSGRPVVEGGDSTEPGSVDSANPPQAARLEDEEWYHGLMPREDINRMLRKQGDFIVRKSEVDGKVKHVLSIHWDHKTRHVVLHLSSKNRHLIDPNDRDFGTISELINFYWQKQIHVPRTNYLLINPVPRQEWELRHEDVRLAQKLGEGAFGEVFKGELVRHNKDVVPVAVKRSHAHQELTKDQINELIAEVRIMQRFKHDNVVRLYGVAAEVQPIMIVMELASGGSLDSYLRKNGATIKHLDKTRYALDAAKGMTYLHEMTCVHRDLAARNCLINGDIVKIADFGLSSLGGFYKMQKNAKVPVRWLSPETMLKAYYDYKTDVWSFGIMLWEIFMDGIEPYPGMRVMEVQQAVAKQNYRMPLPFDWPFQVRTVIDQCWQSEPEQRPAFAKLVEILTQAVKELE